MNNVLESFIKLNDNIIEGLNVKNSIGVFYKKDGNISQLNMEKTNEENNEYFISSTDDTFNLVNDNIFIHGCVSFENVKSLFGMDSIGNAIALDDTVIGVSINAYSLVSKNNFSFPIGEIIAKDDAANISYDIEFPTGALADKLFILVNLYVKEVNTKSNIFASIEGTILGTINTTIINLEGNGSIFPVKVVSSNSEPLWFVDLNYDDLNDPFGQNRICLNINSAHVDFDKIGSQDITRDNNAMWKEIFASFFSQIFLGLSQNDKNDIFDNGSFDEGSIGLFLKYILESFDIDKSMLDNPVLLNKKILIGLDSIMK